MTEQVENDIRSSIETMFYTPNYCDLYMHVNQVRELLGFDKSIIDIVVEENKWVIEQFRKYVGTHRLQIVGHTKIDDMLEEVESMIAKAKETNDAPRELLYMFMRDEWLSQLHAVVANALEATAPNGEEEEYDA